MSSSIDPRLYGTWGSDLSDPATVKRFGRARFIFRPDGTLTFQTETSGVLLVYRVEGDVLITDQPSAPGEEKSRYVVSSDARLTIGEGADASRWVRISAETAMSAEEAAIRRRATQFGRSGPPGGVRGGANPKEFRVPGLKVWYPADWRQNYHEDGAPYFIGPRDDSGLIRIGILRIVQTDRPRGLFAKKTPDLEERLQVLVRGEPGSTVVQLGTHRVVYSKVLEGQHIHHRWTLPEKTLVIVGTYTERRDASETPNGREELETARRIMSSLQFEV